MALLEGGYFCKKAILKIFCQKTQHCCKIKKMWIDNNIEVSVTCWLQMTEAIWLALATNDPNVFM